MHNLVPALILTLALNSCSSGPSGTGSDTIISNAINESQPEPILYTPYYDNEKTDVARIETILQKVKGINDVNDRVIAVSQEFLGTPYVGGTLNIPPQEQLYVSTSQVDCSTFVEMVMALAIASGIENSDIEDFLRMLQTLRYRDGKILGFPSRLHYISEWALDNGRRGNFREITSECQWAKKRVKTIDFMTKNRQLYPAMANDSVFQAIKGSEKELKDLEFSYIPVSMVDEASKSYLKSGDIVAIVTDKAGLDVSHVGILNIRNGISYLIHASSKYKKVINDTTTLREYLQRQHSPGIRVFRINQN